MIEYDLQYFFYVNGTCVIKSSKESCVEADEDARIMQFDDGVRGDDYVMRQHELADDVIHEETRLCLGDGDRVEGYYAVNRNAGDLVRLGLSDSVRQVVGKSHRSFGASKKPLVILQLFFVESIKS